MLWSSFGPRLTSDPTFAVLLCFFGWEFCACELYFLLSVVAAFCLFVCVLFEKNLEVILKEFCEF